MNKMQKKSIVVYCDNTHDDTDAIQEYLDSNGAAQLIMPDGRPVYDGAIIKISKQLLLKKK
jgi:hypothetical protein